MSLAEARLAAGWMLSQFTGQFPRYNEGMPDPLENRPSAVQGSLSKAELADILRRVMNRLPPAVQDSPSKPEPVEAPLPDGPPSAGNRGRFRRGDPRINREGRPRGSKAGSAEGGAPAVRAPCADRLMLLVLPGVDSARR
jgi:hypothetical protein